MKAWLVLRLAVICCSIGVLAGDCLAADFNRVVTHSRHSSTPDFGNEHRLDIQVASAAKSAFGIFISDDACDALDFVTWRMDSGAKGGATNNYMVWRETTASRADRAFGFTNSPEPSTALLSLFQAASAIAARPSTFS